jgi:hypothetical protein
MSNHDDDAYARGDFAAGKEYEPETVRGPMIIFGWVVALSAAFFISLGALAMYFKHEAAKELDKKVWSVESEELKALRAKEADALKGKGGVSIDEAMKRVAQETK